MARARFGGLSQAELELLRAAQRGRMAVCGPPDPKHPDNDPAHADDWGPDREIRAELIRWLCVDTDARTRVDPRGIRVLGAKITRELDLSFACVPFPLLLVRCRLTHDADLTSAEIPLLALPGTWVKSVSADRANVKGGVFLGEGFSAEGEVRLLGAQIGGNLECTGGTFRNAGGKALAADRANVAGSIFLREGFSAEGEVRLLGAQIGGNLDCIGGTFKNPPQEGIEGSGKAFNADGANVTGSVFLRQGFTAEGEVRLLGAQIGGQLACTGGTFKNPKGKALNADGANVTGGVFLRDGFSAEGEVRLPGAQIGGNLECTGGGFTELTAQTATVQGALFWRNVKDAKGAKLDLRKASVGAIADDEASWPERGKLFLDGFVYQHIAEGPTDAAMRLKWLARQQPSTLQPYRQLAKVLRETGDARGAREVLYEMEHRRRKQRDRNRWARLWGLVLKITIGYGHKSHWALGWLGLLTFAGFLPYGLGYASGAITPSDKDAYSVFEATGQPPSHFPRFDAFVFSMEHSFPLVNLGQKDKWQPNPQASGREPLREWSSFETLRDIEFRDVRPFRLPWPGVLRFFLWFQIIFGWALAALFVAGFTGIVRAE